MLAALGFRRPPLDTPQYASLCRLGKGCWVASQLTILLIVTGTDKSTISITRSRSSSREDVDRRKQFSVNRIGRSAPWLASPNKRPLWPTKPDRKSQRPSVRPLPRPSREKGTVQKKSPKKSESALNGDLPSLVIVESPKKARSIDKFLGSAYVVKASMGHVRDLPKRKLGLDVANGYEPSYEIVPTKKDTIGDLKRAASKAGLVYLATDPDREGEAIAWHLQQALELPDDRVRRVTFHEITERAVKEAFGHSGPINMAMVNAQQARRFLDRFVGYQISPLLWKKVGART